MVCYKQMDYKIIAFLVCNGSPTCGYNLTSFNADWGGCAKALDYGDALIEGQGVFIEELHSAIHDMGLDLPAFYGLNLDELAKLIEDIIKGFDEFIACEMKNLNKQ